jgi:hypothetical protein
MSKSRWIYRNGKTVGKETRYSDGCVVRQQASQGFFGNQAGRVTSRTRKSKWS